MAAARLTTVTPRSFSRALAKEHPKYYEKKSRSCFLRCPKCDRVCMVGQVIVTKRCKANTKWYHKKCAEALNIIWSEDESQ